MASLANPPVGQIFVNRGVEAFIFSLFVILGGMTAKCNFRFVQA